METPQPQILGPLRLPQNAIPVLDADEEVFLLYTRLAALKPADADDSGHFRGLGFLDSNEDSLTVTVELEPPRDLQLSQLLAKGTGRSKRRNAKRSSKAKDSAVSLGFELFQDKTALRSRSGDTGSVLWRASIDFLKLVLGQHHFPDPDALFDSTTLSQSHTLELGAGTGLLAVALGPLVRRYTATDIPALVPLLRKNLSHARSQPDTTATALDWAHPPVRQLPAAVLADPADLLLVVDCIYHPALVPPLLDTISALAVPRRTAVLVVSELRAEDVVRTFLEGWLARANEVWRIWSVGGDGEGALMGARYAVWVGWRES
ncbi:hypothetical protein FA95DRAFT_1560050 [Auriscalpium vulgare]|uniref:Uncharacterized protein n=1 Tax=Auriscalpium vulgare TaxID=40419 RepID=A0ACB8RRL8_9AGAM|nr:hypothetical protein FA95DRAFT_1560050 [Auriscalpium vulgare]